jgi:hypothetical protein
LANRTAFTITDMKILSFYKNRIRGAVRLQNQRCQTVMSTSYKQSEGYILSTEILGVNNYVASGMNDLFRLGRRRKSFHQMAPDLGLSTRRIRRPIFGICAGGWISDHL